MNSSGQQLSPPHVTTPVPPSDESKACKRYLSVAGSMRPFKKARHASQIKNYDFTIGRMRERAQREASVPAPIGSVRRNAVESLTAAHMPELASSPDRSYERLVTQHQLALLQQQQAAQQQQNALTATPVANHHLGDLSALQQQQKLEEIARLGGLTKELTMPQQFVSAEQLAHGGYPTAGQFGMLQWHTSQLAKNFLGPNAVNHMIEHLACSREEERAATIRSYDFADGGGGGDEQRPRDAAAAHHPYLDNLDGGSTSDDCDTSDEESDDIRGGSDEFYGESAATAVTGAGGGPLQICDTSLVFHQQLALAHMQSFRLQAAKASAELQQAARMQAVSAAADDDDVSGNAQSNCDDSVCCDGGRVAARSLDIDGPGGPIQGVPTDKIYCNLKCDCNCDCKIPSPPPGKEPQVAGETGKFAASAISNISSMPIKTDTGYPQA